MRIPLPTFFRITFVIGAAWAAVLAAVAPVHVEWWTTTIRVGVAGPVIAWALWAAIRPTDANTRTAAGLLAGWSAAQIIRLQIADYSWQTIVAGSATYCFLAILALILGIASAVTAGFTCAGRSAGRDRVAR